MNLIFENLKTKSSPASPAKPDRRGTRKKIIIIAAISGVFIVLTALLAGYFLLYYQKDVIVLEELPFSPPQQQAVAEIEELVEVEKIEYDTADVVSEKVTEEIPELNPVKKTNPFKDAYKNPFE